MKWPCALVALALMQPSHVRGLKAPRVPDENAVLSKQLQIENEALRKKNQHLEAMMQMARAEVHRMDAAAAVSKRQRRTEKCDEAEVLKQEIQDLKKKIQTTESEKTDLVQTLRRMLAKNATKIFQREAEKAQDRSMALELRCGQERQALEAQIQAANGKIKEANEKCDDIKEAGQALQDENEDLRQKMQALRNELAKVEGAKNDLSSNKAYLVTTMQTLMRENTRLKHGLQKETDIETKDAKELVATKAMLAKLKKNAPKPAVQKQSKTKLKAKPAHYRHHHESTAAERAHMRAINSYIVDAEAPSDDDSDDLSEQQLSAVQRQAELVTKGKKVGSQLGDWLGFKKAVQDTNVGSTTGMTVQKQKAKAPAVGGDESEAEAILKEAKANLAAMESSTTDA